ncbi:MAG: hypothetical protein CJBNEKGG_02607 [Prosthecobacter sp.]|nr:hypothetical protein [Prosthecobacter sp.]
MMKKLVFVLLVHVGQSATAQVTLNAPTDLTAVWEEGAGTTYRPLKLTWNDLSNGESGYMIEKKVGTGAWTALSGASGAAALPPGTVAHTDTSILRSVSTRTHYYYRVRALNGAGKSGAAEVATVAVPSEWPTSNYDSDADGITDAREVAAGLDPQDWRDATGDSDGDLIPNAWEAYLGTNLLGRNTLSEGSPLVNVTVDASYTGTDTATKTKTLTAAITKLGSTTTVPAPFRVILVKPGVYNETINNTSAFQVAFIADRSGANPRAECVIQGVSNNPVISTTGSAVFDGFVIARNSGTTGAAFASSESATPGNRVSTVRLVNCIVRNINLGGDAVVRQTGGRLVLAHDTFFMNSADAGAQAHSYSSGALSGTAPLESTARLRVMNCIFWNPIRTTVPEFFSVGDYRIQSSLVYGPVISGSEGTRQINPGLTPKAYLMSNASPASIGGTVGKVHVMKDIHGEDRYNPPGVGADEWYDSDQDQIPDFADFQPLSVNNAGADDDQDLLTELGEYQAGTSLQSADSQYLTLEQALRLFVSPTEYLTRSEGDARYMPLNPAVPRKVRVAPGGGIDMGEFD